MKSELMELVRQERRQASHCERGRELAGRQGVEPRLAGPEPAVLPLDDLPVPAIAKSINEGGCGGIPALEVPGSEPKVQRVPVDIVDKGVDRRVDEGVDNGSPRRFSLA